MAWKPTFDYDEELVNFKPDQDIKFGFLSEGDSHPFYPRPDIHIKQAMLMNSSSAVQQMAGTKPLGELPSVTDWNTDKGVEVETIAMIRHFGMGPSVDVLPDKNITIATYPIENDVEMMKKRPGNKMPLFLNDNLFKLKPNKEESYVYKAKSSDETYDTISSSQEYEPKDLGTNKKRKKKLFSHAERLQQYSKLKEEDYLGDEQMSSSASSDEESFKKARSGYICKYKSDSKSTCRSKLGSRGEWMNSSNTSLNSSASSSSPLLSVACEKVAKKVINKPAAASATAADTLPSPNVMEFSELWLLGKNHFLPQAN